MGSKKRKQDGGGVAARKRIRARSALANVPTAKEEGSSMCLAIPAKIASLDGDGMATVDILGVTRSVSIDLTPQAGVGDFVLVHAGFAIEVVDPDYAQETIDLIQEFPDLAGDEMPPAVA